MNLTFEAQRLMYLTEDEIEARVENYSKADILRLANFPLVSHYITSTLAKIAARQNE